MARVIADMSVSLDGFVADRDDGIDEVFAWMMAGPARVETANEELGIQTDEASATDFAEAMQTVGALVAGRRTFDLAEGWNGTHPMGVPVFVVTHEVPEGWPREGSEIHFVTDGAEAALERAKAVAGEKTVAVASPNVTQQYLNAGLLDGVRISQVPVVLGDGVPLFANLTGTPIHLETPEVTEGQGVTHLYYRVRSKEENR